MNVNDFDVEIPEGDMLATVFNYQRKLMNKYHEIEQSVVGRDIVAEKDEHGPYCGSLSLQDRQAQMRFKDFAWRITEELTEATECLVPGSVDETHYLEELIDALHFSVELLILCGLTQNSLLDSKAEGDLMTHCFFQIRANTEIFSSPSYSLRSGARQHALRLSAYKAIETLGCAMNCLKLKPWKATPQLTDEKRFQEFLRAYWRDLIELMVVSAFTAKSLTAMYLNKNAVNQFRQRSNY